MEEFLKLQREELLQRGARDQDHSGPNPHHQWLLEDDKSFLEDQEEDDPEEADLAFITSMLESFSQPKTLTSTHATKSEHNLVDRVHSELLPEGTLTQEGAKRQVTPPKFNYNVTIKMPVPEEFSCFPAVEEGGTEEFLDKSDEDKNYTEETGFENTPMFCSITEARKIHYLQHGDHSFPATGKKTLPKARLLSSVGNPPLCNRASLRSHLPRPDNILRQTRPQKFPR
jgi:hypothetical protein